MSLKIVLSPEPFDRCPCDLLLVAVPEDAVETDPRVKALDQRLSGQLGRLLSRAEFTGRADQSLDVDSLGQLPAATVGLIGLGNNTAPQPARVRDWAATAVRHAAARGASHVALAPASDLSDEAVRQLAEGIWLGAYRFDRYLTGERRPKRLVEQVTVLVPRRPGAAMRRSLERGKQVAEAVCLARDAVNEPPNQMTPQVLAERAVALAHRAKLSVKVLDAKGIDRAGMKLLAAVGRGSRNEPRFVHLHYTPKQRKKKRIVLVGKGLSFDSGGLCIKPAQGMNEMKSDMAGAAAVMGVLSAVAALGLPVELHGILVAAENMPDGGAYRPGDVFGSLDGRTVEIINTDAEGRLVLADGLAFAVGLHPDLIIDVATLTGACVVALGKGTTGYFATDDAWATQLEAAACRAGESFWRLPLLPDLREQLKSDVADLKHHGDRWGGAIIAALFLQEFVGQVPFIHCDIAGPALSERAKGAVPKGGTGHAVLTLLGLVEGID